jgi:hypothetical protein
MKNNDNKNIVLLAVTLCSLVECYLLGLIFDPEHGGSSFLRNVCKLLLDYVISHLDRRPITVSAVRKSYSMKNNNGFERRHVIFVHTLVTVKWNDNHKCKFKILSPFLTN